LLIILQIRSVQTGWNLSWPSFLPGQHLSSWPSAVLSWPSCLLGWSVGIPACPQPAAMQDPLQIHYPTSDTSVMW
jgi:hypothetical protein